MLVLFVIAKSEATKQYHGVPKIYQIHQTNSLLTAHKTCDSLCYSCLDNNWFPPSLRFGENKALETDALRAQLSAALGCHATMEFCLHYYGKLKSRDTAAGKHLIRQAFDAQIRSLCSSDPFVHGFKGDLEGTRKEKEKPMYVEHGSKRYWFLISEHLKTVVDLNITILVPHEVGRIVHNGGDIDNRIKTLFDALRVPAIESEIPSSDSFDYSNNGMFCLLQDDKLINRVSIKSYRDHQPDNDDSVKCLIEVETKITQALWGNLNFV